MTNRQQKLQLLKPAGGREGYPRKTAAAGPGAKK